jgi:hypothetical protein
VELLKFISPQKKQMCSSWLFVIPSSVCLPISYPFPENTICSKALLASLVRLHGSSHLRINRCAMGS